MSSVSYPVINDVSCVPELEVSFKTYNRLDNQTYRGRIVGSVNFEVARNFDDVISTHADMSAEVAKKELAVETFLLVKTADGATRPFAIAWIDNSTFRAIDAMTDSTIVIHGVTSSELYEIIRIIRNLGHDVTQK